MDPAGHDLRVTQFRQAALQAPRCLAHLAPIGVAVERGEAFGQRAATTERDAEIMDGVGGQCVASLCLFFQDAAQKVRQGVRQRGVA
jgi:hypothetical protein